MTESSGGRRLYLHVGLPKSGTTFLQALLDSNRDRLLEGGVLYPSPDTGSMFYAAIEVRGTYPFWGLPKEAVEGHWESLCRAVRAHDGVSVISHEILSAATPEQIAAAAEHLQGVEVHLVVTARDVVRQVTAVWQENLKNGDTRSFAKFAKQVMADLDSTDPQLPFWRMQNLSDVLHRWGTLVPPERTHVVTAPRSAGDPLELWRRFAEVVGFDPETMDHRIERANESLGVAQAALLRDVNESLDGRIEQPQYSRVVKEMFAQRMLPRHRSSRAVLPPDLFGALRELSEAWVKELESTGSRVHGDLADLLPDPPPTDAPHPDDVSDAERYAVAREVVADLLVEVAGLRERRPEAPRSAPLPRRSWAGRLLSWLRRAVGRLRHRAA
jgi:hypothetical protein